MVTEERNLLGGNDAYRHHYSIARLRRLVEVRTAWNSYSDLWTGLQSTCKLFSDEKLGAVLAVPPLNGDLFALHLTQDLVAAQMANRHFLQALECVVLYQERPQDPKRRINYSALDVEELGSVYESLLDLLPVFEMQDGRHRFRLLSGTERKTTGSYYTPPELVEQLIESALVPVIAERLQGATTREEKRRRLLAISVCDPACGSGHFLLAAARRIARELARADSDGDEPSPLQFRLALRDVIGYCIHGVDFNPLAVELCKVALWLESHAAGKPLSFLNHRILNGNSLVGLRDLKVLKDGIPDDAYKPGTGDERDVAREVKKRNLFATAATLFSQPELTGKELTAALHELNDLADDTPDLIRRKMAALDRAHDSPEYRANRAAAHAFSAAFFAELTAVNANAVPTSGTVNDALAGHILSGLTTQLIADLEFRVRFFHWPLEFPEVFARGGFDVMLSNPPWEMIQLEEQEFFASRDLQIAQAPNGAARKLLIQKLSDAKPELWHEYQQAMHDTDSFRKFLRASNFYPLTAAGRNNSYSLFAERLTSLVAPTGRVGAVLPTGIATDDTNKHFFASVATGGRLVSLFDFENREGLFPAVDSRQKFSLITLRGAPPAAAEPSQFAFFLTRAAHLRDPQRVFELEPGDFDLLNPNTRTCPIFRTRADAELTRKIYRNVPVLVNERTGENPWGISFRQGLFNMTTDSALFRTRVELEGRGFHLSGNRFIKGDELYLPLYEAKMIHQFDHRFGSCENLQRRPPNSPFPTPSVGQYSEAGFATIPWYWISRVDFPAVAASHRWFLSYRRIVRSNDERTTISAIIPMTAAGDVLPIAISDRPAPEVARLLGALNSLPLDFATRQKVGGIHLDFHYAKQLPLLTPEACASPNGPRLTALSTELTCTAWDVQPFLDDVWCEADDALKTVLLRQWEENRDATGGHAPEWPEWYTPAAGRFPHPPFKWNEDRRALLRATLDALYAQLYGLTDRDLRYILDPQDVMGPDFPGETFRVLKNNEIRKFGEYRTRRLVLEAWDRLQRGDLT